MINNNYLVDFYESIIIPLIAIIYYNMIKMLFLESSLDCSQYRVAYLLIRYFKIKKPYTINDAGLFEKNDIVCYCLSNMLFIAPVFGWSVISYCPFSNSAGTGATVPN